MAGSNDLRQHRYRHHIDNVVDHRHRATAHVVLADAELAHHVELQMTSPSSLFSFGSDLNGPSFSPSRKPSVSKADHETSARNKPTALTINER